MTRVNGPGGAIGWGPVEMGMGGAHDAGQPAGADLRRQRMRDAVETMSAARLRRELDEQECKRRNALSRTIPGFALRAGDVGTVLESLGNIEAFLVEFNRSGKAPNGECDWLGVLYPTEIEVVDQRQG